MFQPGRTPSALGCAPALCCAPDEELELAHRPLAQNPAAGRSSKAGGNMESRKLCAYNQTRECFLGLEVDGADLSLAKLKDRIATLALKSGEGLWLTPFRGLPEWGIRVPLDLLYLDQDCRVIDVVESYPVFRANAATPQPATCWRCPPTPSIRRRPSLGDQLVLVRCRRNAAAARTLHRAEQAKCRPASAAPASGPIPIAPHQAPRGRCAAPHTGAGAATEEPRRASCRVPSAQGKTAVERRSGAARIGEPLG